MPRNGRSVSKIRRRHRAVALEFAPAGIAAMAEAGVALAFMETHLILGEGDFVLVQSAGTFGGKDVTFHDLVGVAGGKVVEHWDVSEPLTPPDGWRNANGKF